MEFENRVNDDPSVPTVDNGNNIENTTTALILDGGEAGDQFSNLGSYQDDVSYEEDILNEDDITYEVENHQPIQAALDQSLYLEAGPYYDPQAWDVNAQKPPKSDEMLALLLMFEELMQRMRHYWPEEFQERLQELWKDMAKVADDRIHNIDDLTRMMEGLNAFT